MTELRLIAGTALAEPAEAEAVPTLRLPPGRHGIPADLVRAHQRLRLLEAAATAVAEQGYGRITAARVTELAGVSSRTFYQHFEDLWACLLAAYETEASRLCEGIEAHARPWSSSAARSPQPTGAAGRGPASPRRSASSPPSRRRPPAQRRAAAADRGADRGAP